MQLIVCTAVVLFFLTSLFILLCICLFITAKIFFLCVFFVCIYLFITTFIFSYFSAWLSHLVQLAFAISEWLCSLFSQLFPFNDATLLYQEHNKDFCRRCCYAFRVDG